MYRMKKENSAMNKVSVIFWRRQKMTTAAELAV